MKTKEEIIKGIGAIILVVFSIGMYICLYFRLSILDQLHIPQGLGNVGITILMWLFGMLGALFLIIFVIIIVYFIFISKIRNNSSKYGIGFLFGVVVIISVYGPLFYHEWALSHVLINDFSQAAINACQGKGTNNAAIYDKEQNIIHPIIIINNSQNYSYIDINKYPKNWFPKSINELQLVACLGKPYSEKVGGCDYSLGGHVDIYQKFQEINIVSAYSGKSIKRYRVFGHASGCPSSKSPVDNSSNIASDITVEIILNSLIPTVSNLQ